MDFIMVYSSDDGRDAHGTPVELSDLLPTPSFAMLVIATVTVT
jgi:hypothetical protein